MWSVPALHVIPRFISIALCFDMQSPPLYTAYALSLLHHVARASWLVTRQCRCQWVKFIRAMQLGVVHLPLLCALMRTRRCLWQVVAWISVAFFFNVLFLRCSAIAHVACCFRVTVWHALPHVQGL